MQQVESMDAGATDHRRSEGDVVGVQAPTLCLPQQRRGLGPARGPCTSGDDRIERHERGALGEEGPAEERQGEGPEQRLLAGADHGVPGCHGALGTDEPQPPKLLEQRNGRAPLPASLTCADGRHEHDRVGLEAQLQASLAEHAQGRLPKGGSPERPHQGAARYDVRHEVRVLGGSKRGQRCLPTFCPLTSADHGVERQEVRPNRLRSAHCRCRSGAQSQSRACPHASPGQQNCPRGPDE
mmetsp:Transcript_119798/g.383597  ORF Transcript_119798/g.383597 Transcript_119798/m.383597 type:complete len:240 (-) Transcript_119798:54-773(-)